LAAAVGAAVAGRRPRGNPGARWSAAWWRAQLGSPARIREWALAEVGAGRLLPWFAVAYGAGIVLYFAAEREPALWAGAVVTILSTTAASTQRSYIMIAVVLVGVLLAQPTLTMRTLTIAALIVLGFAPESIVHPSFQMSFAATLALIAGYERGAIKLRAAANSSLGARAALWGVNEIIGLTIASLPAGWATTPYAAYHFHRLAPYGVLANLLAMPIVSAWVMPMGILGIVTMPLGLDAEFWRQMGYGIEWMNAVGLWVAGLPGAYGRITLFGAGPLLLATGGLLVIGLLKTPLRWTGILPLALSVFWAAATLLPDVLIAADGRSFAMRGAATAGSRFIMSAATALPRVNGSRPMPTVATRMIPAWGRGSPAIRPAASASSPMGRAPPMCLRRQPMRKIAGERFWWWRCAAIRRQIARPWSFDGRYGVSAARWRCAGTARNLRSIQRVRRSSVGAKLGSRQSGARVNCPIRCCKFGS
jgi:ComEC/Rec2-related protein